jgi:hypothetical protein
MPTPSIDEVQIKNDKKRKSVVDLPLGNGQILDCPILKTKTEVIHYQQHHSQHLGQKGQVSWHQEPQGARRGQKFEASLGNLVSPCLKMF